MVVKDIKLLTKQKGEKTRQKMFEIKRNLEQISFL